MTHGKRMPKDLIEPLEMPDSSKLKWKGLLRVLGPLLFIFFFMKVVDPRSVIDHLRGIRMEIVLASAGLFPVLILAFTFRWWIICRQLKMTAAFAQLFRIFYISWFFAALPISGSAALSKAVYLKEEGTPTGSALISIILDKLFDVIGLMFFGLYGLLYFPKDLFGGQLLWTVYGAMAVALLTCLVCGKRIWEGLRTFLNRSTKRKYRKIGRSLDANLTEFWSGFNLRFVSVMLVNSVFIGLLRALVLYLLAISLNMHVAFSLMVACRALVGMANVIPVSIGGLGTRDAVLLLTLPLAGISREAAISLGFAAFLWALCSNFSGVAFWFKRPLPSKGASALKEELLS